MGRAFHSGVQIAKPNSLNAPTTRPRIVLRTATCRPYRPKIQKGFTTSRASSGRVHVIVISRNRWTRGAVTSSSTRKAPTSSKMLWSVVRVTTILLTIIHPRESIAKFGFEQTNRRTRGVVLAHTFNGRAVVRVARDIVRNIRQVKPGTILKYFQCILYSVHDWKLRPNHVTKIRSVVCVQARRRDAASVPRPMRSFSPESRTEFWWRMY